MCIRDSPRYDAISSANLGFVVPLTSLNLVLVRLKFDSLLCIAVIKLVTKFAPKNYISMELNTGNFYL